MEINTYRLKKRSHIIAAPWDGLSEPWAQHPYWSLSGDVYIELPTNADADQAGVAYLSIICIPSVRLTIRRGRIVDIQRLMTSLQEDRLEFGNTSNLLYKLINFFERTVNQSLYYRQQTDKLEDQLKRESGSFNHNEGADQRRHLTQLEFICEDQVLCAKSLVS